MCDTDDDNLMEKARQQLPHVAIPGSGIVTRSAIPEEDDE